MDELVAKNVKPVEENTQQLRGFLPFDGIVRRLLGIFKSVPMVLTSNRPSQQILAKVVEPA